MQLTVGQHPGGLDREDLFKGLEQAYQKDKETKTNNGEPGCTQGIQCHPE